MKRIVAFSHPNGTPSNWAIYEINHWLLGKFSAAIKGINQQIALGLDTRWACKEETAGYFVVARKP